MKDETTPTMLRAADVAARLRCDQSTVRRYAAQGLLPAVRIGSMLRFRVADVERLEQEGTFTPAKASSAEVSIERQAAPMDHTHYSPRSPEERARETVRKLRNSQPV